MKKICFILAGLLFLFSCEYQDNGVTSIDNVITSDYLLAGNLDTYIQNNQIVRLKGKPGITEVSIGNADLTKYQPCFVLYVATGTTPETTVSSAIIKLDDMVVLNTSDFSKNSGQYQFEVCNLTQTSVLTVEVRGEPNSYVNVWIEGKKKNLIGFNPDLTYGSVIDIEGNIYKTIQIGNQNWMAENLRTTKFNDGIDIPTLEDYYFPPRINPSWDLIRSACYCWYNDDIGYKSTYGALYKKATPLDKLCPVGWRVPSNADYAILAYFLGGVDIAGNKLKETGTTHWWDPNSGATNESGFTALPGGYRDIDCLSMGRDAQLMTTNSGVALYYNLPFLDIVPEGRIPEIIGMSVRCIKEN